MNTTPQFQDFPNPNPNPNPNPYPNFEDQFAYTTHHHDQLNNLMYFRDISNYLMSDEGSEGLTTELHSKIISENTVDFFDKSSSSAPFTHNIKRTRKVKIYKAQEEFRLAFRTRSDLDVMDDGFKWRKYGKKKVKNSPNPRNYFKCTREGCSVKKRVERDREDSSYVITTYEGVHNHDTPNPTCVLYSTPQPSSLNIHTSSL